MIATQSSGRACSAGFKTCCIADFQIGRRSWFVWLAGLEARDTADWEVRATFYGLPALAQVKASLPGDSSAIALATAEAFGEGRSSLLKPGASVACLAEASGRRQVKRRQASSSMVKGLTIKKDTSFFPASTDTIAIRTTAVRKDHPVLSCHPACLAEASGRRQVKISLRASASQWQIQPIRQESNQNQTRLLC